MPDFPQTVVSPLFINTVTRHMVGMNGRIHLGQLSGSGAALNWPVANQACYVPLRLPFPYNVRRLFWGNGTTVGGNASIGIYTSDGGQIYGSASTVTSGASALQYVTPATDILLPPGNYYIGISFSGTTAVAWGWAGVLATGGRLNGLYQQASAVPMPSPATFAAWNSVGLPLVGITKTASGF